MRFRVRVEQVAEPMISSDERRVEVPGMVFSAIGECNTQSIYQSDMYRHVHLATAAKKKEHQPTGIDIHSLLYILNRLQIYR